MVVVGVLDEGLHHRVDPFALVAEHAALEVWVREVDINERELALLQAFAAHEVRDVGDAVALLQDFDDGGDDRSVASEATGPE